LIAAEVDDLCEDWMKHADQVLADELLVAAVYDAPAPRRRPQTATPFHCNRFPPAGFTRSARGHRH
jgi:hypothetical protein